MIAKEAQREKDFNGKWKDLIAGLFWRKKTFTETRKWQSENTRPEEVRKKMTFPLLQFSAQRKRIRAEIAGVQSGFNSAAGRSRWQRLAESSRIIDLQWETWVTAAISEVTEFNLMQISSRLCSGVSVATQLSVRLQRAFCVCFVMINNHCSAGVYKHTHKSHKSASTHTLKPWQTGRRQRGVNHGREEHIKEVKCSPLIRILAVSEPQFSSWRESSGDKSWRQVVW